jgi:glycosyltransferase involved in cell wall biosynthesis
MRIAIEAISLSSENITGIGNVTLHYIRELQKIDADNRYFIYTIDGLRHVDIREGRWEHIQYNCRIKNIKYDVTSVWKKLRENSPRTASSLARIYYLRILKMALEAIDAVCLHVWLASSLRKNRIDVYFGTFADFFPFFFFHPVRTIWLIHDLVWKLFPETQQTNTLVRNRLIVRNMNRADLLLSVSDSTRSDLISLLNVRKKIITLHNAADRSIFHRTDDASINRVKRKYGITKKYMLSVCTLEPRKNLTSLLEAYAMMDDRGRHQLVLVGMSGWKNTALFGLIEDHPAKEGIVITGYIPAEDLAPIYTGAEVFVFPTLYEGFGLPVLEAMQCGCPVISSATSSIPEVAGDACMLVDPQDVPGLASAIQKVLSGGSVRNEMVRKGLARSRLFSWEKSAERLLEILRAV